MEFQSSRHEATRDDDKGTTQSVEDNTSKRRTWSEVWGMDPNKKIWMLSATKSLITKMMWHTWNSRPLETIEEVSIHQKKKLWRDAMDYKLA